MWRGRLISVEVLDGRWEVVRHASAVAIVITDGSRVLGVEQDRPAIGRRTWELPAGLIDPGEAPQEAAARELAEEVQLAAELELLTRFYVSPGFTDEEVLVYRGRNARPAHGVPDEGEDLSLRWREAQEVWDAAARGEVAISASTAAGLRQVLAELRGAG